MGSCCDHTGIFEHMGSVIEDTNYTLLNLVFAVHKGGESMNNRDQYIATLIIVFRGQSLTLYTIP